MMRIHADFAILLLSALLFGTACQRDCEEAASKPTPSLSQPRAMPYTMPGLNHGLSQSPINILSKHTEDGEHDIAINLHDAAPNLLKNKGHTIELEFPHGSTVSFDGKDYALKQVHFHTPSEHQIDGVTFPMEMHFVNMIEPKSADDPPLYLVIAFLYKMGDEDTFIASFLDQVPSEEGGETLSPDEVSFAAETEHPEYDYYHYRGSLTTPPYTETVEWLIVKEIDEASPEQIRRINLLEGDNARRVQARYDRVVEH